MSVQSEGSRIRISPLDSMLLHFPEIVLRFFLITVKLSVPQEEVGQPVVDLLLVLTASVQHGAVPVHKPSRWLEFCFRLQCREQILIDLCILKGFDDPARLSSRQAVLQQPQPNHAVASGIDSLYDCIDQKVPLLLPLLLRIVYDISPQIAPERDPQII